MLKKGVYLSVLAAIISGVSIFSNALFVSKTDPLIFTIIRNGVVAILLTVILVLSGQAGRLKGLTWRQWGQLLSVGAIGGGIPFALFFTGLAQIGGLNGNIIQKTLFLWVAVIAVPLLHERLSKVQLVGYVILLAGMFFFGGTFTVLPVTGTWLVLAATILWAIENVIAKVILKSIPPSIVSWGRMAFGLPFLIIAAGMVGRLGLLSHASSYQPMPILVSGLLLTMYVSTWYSALSRAPATVVSSVLVFAPVITAFLTGLVLKKPVLQQQAGNIVLLTLGAILVAVERMIPKKQTSSV